MKRLSRWIALVLLAALSVGSAVARQSQTSMPRHFQTEPSRSWCHSRPEGFPTCSPDDWTKDERGLGPAGFN
jgi:hypothetical protein